MTLTFAMRRNEKAEVPTRAGREAQSRVAMPPELSAHMSARARRKIPAPKQRRPWAGLVAMAGGLGGLVLLAHFLADIVLPAPDVGMAADLRAPIPPSGISAPLAVVAEPPVFLTRPYVPIEDPGFYTPGEPPAPPPAYELDGRVITLAALNDRGTQPAEPALMPDEPVPFRLPVVPSEAANFMPPPQQPEPTLPASEPAFFAPHLANVLHINPPTPPIYTSPSTTMPQVQAWVPPLSTGRPATDMLVGLDLPDLTSDRVARLLLAPDEPVPFRQPAIPSEAENFMSPPQQPEPALAARTGPAFSEMASRSIRPPPPRPAPSPVSLATAPSMDSAPLAGTLQNSGPNAGRAHQPPPARPASQPTRAAAPTVATNTIANAIFAEVAIGPGSGPFSPASVIARSSGGLDQGTLVGVFSNGTSRWALLRLRDGRVLRIEPGDRLGPARVVSIDAVGVALDTNGAGSLLRVGMEMPTIR